MLSTIAQLWWVLLLRSIGAILFGVFAILRPGVTLWTLIIVFGAYALVDGMGSRDDAGTVHLAKKPVVAHPDDVYEWQNTPCVPVILLLNHLPAAQRYQAPASMPAEGA